ncbi:MAG: hypothetical protein JXD19_10080 [Deltaproteobacteria bacterium]|nr:hypothetical protein [Deltaproteobacteria bacterium]
MKLILRYGLFFVLFFFGFFLVFRQCCAEIIKYRDQDGTIRFAADASRIPEGATIIKVFGTKDDDTGGGTEKKSEEQTTTEPLLQQQPSLQDEIIINVLQDLVRVYHATHTYSLQDFYVCADMAMDLWNMVETKGINARIGVGNVHESQATWRDFNHAWVVAEYSPGKWLALEATRGSIVRGNDNTNYYHGYFFDTPRELKEYVDRTRQFYELSRKAKKLYEEMKKVEEDYERELRKNNLMVDECNRKYPDQRLSRSRYNEYRRSQEQIAQQATVVKELKGQHTQLMELIEDVLEERRAFEGTIDLAAEKLPVS